jgi:hypothetical protein
MAHAGHRPPQSLVPLAQVAWLLLLVCAGYSAWVCDGTLRTLPNVEAGHLVMSPGALMFLLWFPMTVLKALCAVVLWAWVVRAAQNLRAFGVLARDGRSIENLGLWFVPILNWVTTSRGLSELWRGSEAAAGGTAPGSTNDRPPMLVIVWLLVWITHGLGSIATLLLYGSPDQAVWFKAWLVRDAALILAAPPMAAVIFKISRLHTRALVKWRS